MSARETIAKITKRTLLVGGAAFGGGLIVGYLMLRDRPGTAGFEDWGESGTALNAWIKITPDGEIIFAVPRAEMGQGVYTSVAMLIAEELEVDLDQIKVEHPDLDGKYTNFYMVRSQLGDGFPPLTWLAERVVASIPLVGTGGSLTIRDAWISMREAGAAAREMLIAAAAERWGVEPAQCHAQGGRIVNRETRGSLDYGELVDEAALLGPRPIPPFKDRSEFRLIGKPVPRLDIPSKVSGNAEFAIDVKRDDMLYAAMRSCPFCGSVVKSYDGAAAKRMPGVVGIVEVDNGIAVVADSYWRARTAADALNIEFGEGNRALNTKDIFSEFIGALDKSDDVYIVQNDGDVAAALANAAQTVEAIYEAPFLAHTCMEPMNCTVLVDGESAEVWVGTQSPTMAAWGVAKGAGVASENVTCHTTFMGGGFGRRAELDWIAQASQIARAMEGRPVKFIWSREDDIVQDVFRPAAIARFKAGLDDNGTPVAWSNRIVTQSTRQSFAQRAMPNLPSSAERDSTMTDGATELPYKIDNFIVDKVAMRLPIQVGNWRSVGHSFNAFFTESFVDELAYAAGQNPLDFRRTLLSDAPRHLAVLDMAAEKAQWDRPRRTGYGRGIAIHESFGTIVAEVADIFASHDGEVRVNRVVCAVDCGSVVNPDTVVAQMESGIVYGLSAVLFGEITIEDGQIVQQNFPDYEAVRMREMPLIETHIMPSTEYPGGAGEPATPPIAAAVTNAIFDAVGVRVRQLPLTRANFWTV